MPASNIFRGFLEGQELGSRTRAREEEAARLQQGRELAQQAAQGGIQSDAFRQLVGTNPTQASQIGSLLGDIGVDREKALFKDARKLNNTLKSGNVDNGLRMIENRLDDLDRLNGDPTDTLEIKNLITSGNIQGAIELLDTTEQAGVQSGLLSSPAGTPDPKDISVGATVHGRDAQGNPRVGTQTFNKRTGKSEIAWADGGAIQIDKESPLEKTQRRILEAQEKARITGDLEKVKDIGKRRREMRFQILGEGKDAKVAINDLSRIERAIDLLGTGKTSEFKKLMGPFIPGLDPSDPQALEAILNKGLFPVLANFKGAISEGEREFAKQTIANLGFTPEANKMIIDHMKLALKDKVDTRDQFREFAKTNKRFEEFEFVPFDAEKEQPEQATTGSAGDLSDDDLKRVLGL